MTWEDQHARTDIMHTVLRRAAVDPAGPDLFAGIPELERLFGGEEGLLRAVLDAQYRRRHYPSKAMAR
ncbi:hypothetical protein AB0H00_10410 [Nocardia sp. NPDC023852]|uniref:hypothetical protein n=1 Tax=Nocardia sp. NPDC023852 TaxID=3154697 RepID=UPI0033C70269